MQSQKLESHEKVIKNYENVLEDETLIAQRPDYWGGYTFIPYYLESFGRGMNIGLTREMFSIDMTIIGSMKFFNHKINISFT